MAKIAIYTVVYIYFIIFDLYPLYREKKSFWINVGILSFAYVLCILLAFHIKISSPAVPIRGMVEFIFGSE